MTTVMKGQSPLDLREAQLRRSPCPHEGQAPSGCQKMVNQAETVWRDCSRDHTFATHLWTPAIPSA
jgi:hypothetical protein